MYNLPINAVVVGVFFWGGSNITLNKDIQRQTDIEIDRQTKADRRTLAETDRHQEKPADIKDIA